MTRVKMSDIHGILNELYRVESEFYSTGDIEDYLLSDNVFLRVKNSGDIIFGKHVNFLKVVGIKPFSGSGPDDYGYPCVEYVKPEDLVYHKDYDDELGNRANRLVVSIDPSCPNPKAAIFRAANYVENEMSKI